jgi:hypothetical protein
VETEIAPPKSGEGLRNWAIAYTEADIHGWIGRVQSIATEGQRVTLCPAFQYDAQTVTRAGQLEGSVTHSRERRIIPAEMLGSNVKITVMYQSILMFDDLGEKDREMWFANLAMALDMHERLRAQMAGIALAKPGDVDRVGKALGRILAPH